MFPTTEAGDFINSKFVIKKYNLDKGDDDNIKETYGVAAYPTFIFLDGDGKEIARMLGGARDTKGFIERIEATTAKENTWAVRNARFESDPSYAMEHIRFLKEDCYLSKEADAALNTLFAKRDIKENFNKASVDYYNKNISDLKSPVIQYMLNNKKAVIAVMGKTEYLKFIENKADMSIFRFAIGRGFNEANFEKSLENISNNKALQSEFYKFMCDAKEAIIEKDFNDFAEVAYKNNKKASTNLRSNIMRILIDLSIDKTKRAIADENKDEVIEFLEAAAKYEKDDKMKTRYAESALKVKNPMHGMKKGSVPAMRMM